MKRFFPGDIVLLVKHRCSDPEVARFQGTEVILREYAGHDDKWYHSPFKKWWRVRGHDGFEFLASEEVLEKPPSSDSSGSWESVKQITGYIPSKAKVVRGVAA